MKKRLAALLIMAAILFVGIAIAEEIVISFVVPWEDPDWETTWHEVISLEPITAVFTGTVQVRRQSSGEVIFSQDVDTTCVPPDDQPGAGAGACQVQAYPINTDDFEPEQLELWSRAGWIVPGYLKPLWFVWVPPGCDLADADCTIVVGTATGVSVPEACQRAIEECDTVQDSQGFWRIRPFTGTKYHKLYLPLILKEES